MTELKLLEKAAALIEETRKAKSAAGYTSKAIDNVYRACANVVKGVMASAEQPEPVADAMDDQVLRERDRYHDIADKLADAIATHFSIDIGEHSNMNCPWTNALEWIENASPSAAPASQPDAAAIRRKALEELTSKIKQKFDGWENLHIDTVFAYLDDLATQSPAQQEPDNCQFCLGAKGGVRGNENNMNGVVVCDYCTCLVNKAVPQSVVRLDDAAPTAQQAGQPAQEPSVETVTRGRVAYMQVMQGIEPDDHDAMAAAYRAMFAGQPAPASQPDAATIRNKALEEITDDHIREIFLANGFKLNGEGANGKPDLRPYVYQAGRALVDAAIRALATQSEPAQQEPDDGLGGLLMLVVRRPGMAPFLKRPYGDTAAYVREVFSHNPGAEITIVRSWSDKVGCQTVEDAREFLAMEDALRGADAAPVAQQAGQPAPAVPEGWQETAQEVVAVMDKAKKLLNVAGFTMENGTISAPYNAALEKLRDMINAAPAQEGKK